MGRRIGELEGELKGIVGAKDLLPTWWGLLFFHIKTFKKFNKVQKLLKITALVLIKELITWY